MSVSDDVVWRGKGYRSSVELCLSYAGSGVFLELDDGNDACMGTNVKYCVLNVETSGWCMLYHNSGPGSYFHSTSTIGVGRSESAHESLRGVVQENGLLALPLREEPRDMNDVTGGAHHTEYALEAMAVRIGHVRSHFGSCDTIRRAVG